MRHLARNRRFWLLSLVLLGVYLWTFSATATVRIEVNDGRCDAHLSGRVSSIDCPGLTGGRYEFFAEPLTDPADAGLLPWPSPTPIWRSARVVTVAGERLTPDDALPPSLSLTARLRGLAAPAGVALIRDGQNAGWAFVLNAERRQGTWWTWEDGHLGRPLQGIPFDQPFVAQAQALLRQLLVGWQGAVVLALVAGLLAAAWSRAPAQKRLALPPGRTATRAAVIVLTLTVFTVALHVALDVLEAIPHVQDSLTYLFQAQTLARGQLYAPAPPLAESDATAHFMQEFLLVRDGRWFGKYPPGFPAVLALGVRAGAPWLVSPLLAALTVPLLFALGRLLFGGDGPGAGDAGGRTTGLLAAALLALSPFFLVMSGSLMAHPAELFWTCLMMATWAQAVRTGRQRWALAAGVALGMLFLTRQLTAVVIGASFVPGLLLAARGRSALREGARLVVALAAAALPFALLLLAHQAALTGDPLGDPRLLFWPYDRAGFGPTVGEAENVFTVQMVDGEPALLWSYDPAQRPRGHTPARGLYNLGQNLEALESFLFGWPALLALAFVWLAFLLRRPSRSEWLLAAVLLAVGGGYVAYWASGIAYGPRYLYAALPALLLVSARGIEALVAGLGPPTGRRAVATLMVPLVAYSLLQLPGAVEGFRGYNFVTAGPRQAVEAAANEPALVFVTASEVDWWEYGELFSANTPWLDGPIVYARDLGPAENARLAREFPERAAFLWRGGRLAPLDAGP